MPLYLGTVVKLLSSSLGTKVPENAEEVRTGLVHCVVNPAVFLLVKALRIILPNFLD